MLQVQVKISGTSLVCPGITTIVDNPAEDRLFCWTPGSGLCRQVLLIHVQPRNRSFHR